jgi:hypothetical protein
MGIRMGDLNGLTGTEVGGVYAANHRESGIGRCETRRVEKSTVQW